MTTYERYEPGTKLRLTGETWNDIRNNIVVVESVTEHPGGHSSHRFEEGGKDHDWYIFNNGEGADFSVTVIPPLVGIDSAWDKPRYATGGFTKNDSIPVAKPDNSYIIPFKVTGANTDVFEELFGVPHVPEPVDHLTEVIRHLPFPEGQAVQFIATAHEDGDLIGDLKVALEWLEIAIENAEAEEK